MFTIREDEFNGYKLSFLKFRNKVWCVGRVSSEVGSLENEANELK